MTADNTPSASVAEQLAKLREDYQARLPMELAALNTLIEQICRRESDRTRLDEMHHRLHKLAGSGGTFGLVELSAQARRLEYQAKQWLSDTLDAIDTQAWQDFAADVARLGEVVSNPVDAPPPAAGKNRIVQPASDKPTRIWLVEDDPGLAEQLTQQFESFSFSVRHFLTIAEAEATAITQRPDLLIVDTLFPQQGNKSIPALPLCPALCSMGRPVLFISSNDDFHSRALAARLGAQGYFHKPLDVPRLINRITQILGQQNAPQQRILIVDDDVALAAHYRLTLLAAGMEAEVMHEPQDIIETVAAFRPELVLMDFHMPGYTGPELASVIRQYDRWSSLPIVYLSAETDLDRQIEAMGRGADDFLTKPISDARLAAVVRARVDRARELDAQITRDSLTGLLKHANIKEALEVEVLRAQRIGKPITAVMLDIDYFKQVNDTYGHTVGDLVISSLAMLLRQRLRQTDLIGRYGGEEFMAVLPECSAQDAYPLIEGIRQRFAGIPFSHHGQTFNCTLSAGLVSSLHHPQASESERLTQPLHGGELLVAADSALYAAKHGGRDQVRIATPLDPLQPPRQP